MPTCPNNLLNCQINILNSFRVINIFCSYPRQAGQHAMKINGRGGILPGYACQYVKVKTCQSLQLPGAVEIYTCVLVIVVVKFQLCNLYYQQFNSLLTMQYLIFVPLNHCYIFGILNMFNNFIYIHKHKINSLFSFKSVCFSFRSHILNFMCFILDFMY